MKIRLSKSNKNAAAEGTRSVDWMKRRPLYLAISSVVIAVGLISFLSWGFELGVEFTGGTTATYHFEESTTSDQVIQKLKEKNVDVSSIQGSGDNTYILKLKDVNEGGAIALDGAKLESFEQVGPSISTELVKKTFFAILITSTIILGWIAYQFKSLKFGISATLATAHDALVVLGLFSLFGHFFHAELDFLFITALLTILSFSVHDTIVVYDRIRELKRKHGGSLKDIANRALSETMRRSVLNSLTIIIMLVALVVLGGETTRWFAVALLIGTISGTYSSPFVAVPILVTWEEMQKKLKKS